MKPANARSPGTRGRRGLMRVRRLDVADFRERSQALVGIGTPRHCAHRYRRPALDRTSSVLPCRDPSRLSRNKDVTFNRLSG